MSTYSLEHKLFLKKRRRNKWIVHISQIAIVAFFLALWEIAARVGWINTFLASSPSSVMIIYSSGYIGSENARVPGYVRPAIYLKSDVSITSGDGSSSTNAYQISMN